MAAQRSAAMRLLPDVWVVVLVGYLCWPLLTRSGYPLAKDLVFTPRQPLGLDAVGLGDGLPRAVPLDALVGLAGLLMDGATLARLAVAGILLLAGWGASRALADGSVVARTAVATAAVWNPYVIERLALGQWALLAAYAALWWLISALPWAIRDGAARRDVAPALLWVALASITPSGGLLALMLVTVMCLISARNHCASRFSRWSLVAGAAVLQLPWILPSFLSGSGLGSDVDGVAAFAMRAEGVGGVLVAALGLGGIWDASSMPPSRGGPAAVLTATLCVTALVVALPRLRRLPVVGPSVIICGAAGFVLAVASSIPALQPMVRWLVVEVPGGGLLRDAQKWLLPFVILVVMCVGVAVDRVPWRRVGVGTVATGALAAACLPLLLVPDAAPTVWRTVAPVTYPSDFEQVRHVLDSDDDRGSVVVLPWRAYRVFDWGRPSAVYDPASRWFDADVVGSETLEVDEVDVDGEDARAKRIGQIVTAPGPLDRARLKAEGVSDVLIYRDDPQASSIDVTGLESRFEGEYLALYGVGGASVSADDDLTIVERAVIGFDLALLILVVLLLMAALTDLPRRTRARTAMTRQ